MELVYLWVEDYKNIKRQGFNFSPNYYCEFKDSRLSDKSMLSINRKNNPLEHLFSKDINITAIVGENGSGKSSLIKCISKNFDLIVKIDGELYSDTLQKNNKLISNAEILQKKLYEVIHIDDDLLRRELTNTHSLVQDTGSNEYHKVVNAYSDSKTINIEDFISAINQLIIESETSLEYFLFDFIPYEIYIEGGKTLLYSLLSEEEKLEILELNKENKIILFDEEKRTLGELSAGERKILFETLMIHSKIKKSEKNNILLLLDEPDLKLHPEWQKKYINILLSFLSSIDKKIHIVVTTHSPFLLSDIPKENVIFLEKDKNTGNCINVSKDIEINTFGANIHTLLSHGFFMKDGLIGEFAKSKINDVISKINQTQELESEDIKYCESIINIIGEPILKRQLTKMLKDKIEISNHSRINDIELEMKKLSAELEILKNKPNDSN